MKKIEVSQEMLDRMLVAGIESQEKEVMEFALEHGASVDFRNGRAIRRLLENGKLNDWSITILLRLVSLAKPETLTAKNCFGNTVITLLEGYNVESPFYHEPKPIVDKHIISIVKRLSQKSKREVSE